MLKMRGFWAVVNNTQHTPKRVVLGQFQTPLVPDTYETRTRQVPDTTPREAPSGRVEKHSLFMCFLLSAFYICPHDYGLRTADHVPRTCYPSIPVSL
jgi:hypothetical protein